jgi:CASC3/Barentsz eIF4AIII binding
MAPARRHIGASRRKRREDEGEDESSLAGEVEDDSLSEGSADSRQDEEDADAEGSESEDDTTTTAEAEKVNGGQVNGRELDQPQRRSSASPGNPGLKATVSDTEAMLNGLKISGGEEDRSGELEEEREEQPGRTPSAPPTEPKREPLAARKRREQEKFAREREQNPALVPTRGSFFLHDKRTNEAGNGRTSNKAKSRPYGLIVDGNARRYGNLVTSWLCLSLTSFQKLIET